ncbi:MAG: SulP family inorganic anion transporter [Pseudomonadota bacterium]
MKFFDTSHLKGDIYGGLTAGVVALPLALAFGEASGVGPIAGLWGAIFVGFFAALVGGTNTQISGPTGPMVVVFAGVVASVEASVLAGMPDATSQEVLAASIPIIFAAVVLAGVFQILFGVLKFGQYIRLVPYPVVSGFMSGIGCIIIALQLSRLFGHEPGGGGTIPALAAIPGAVMDPNFAALAIGLLTLGIVFLWPKSIGKFVPGPLAALVIGTLVSLVLQGAPILGDIPRGFPELTIPAFSQSTVFIILEAALILAALGAIDSLLTSLVADNMTRTRHNSDRELIGQGVGNTVAGLFGGVPGAGATMRTVVNIRTGGMTKISGMIHSLILLAVVISLAPLAERIPHAVLAGILVKVGYDILDIAYLKRAHKGPRWDLVLMALVLGLTVFVNLITAVGAGVVLAALAFVKKIADDQLKAVGAPAPSSTTEEEAALLKEAKGRVTMFDFGGPLSFGAAADLGHHVRERTREGTSAIVLDFSRVPYLDVSAARAVHTIASDAHAAKKAVYIASMSDEVREVLCALGDSACIPADEVFDTRLEALKTAVDRTNGEDKPKPTTSFAADGAAVSPAE